MFSSALDLPVAATESKKKAKKIQGNSLYFNRRAYPREVVASVEAQSAPQ